MGESRSLPALPQPHFAHRPSSRPVEIDGITLDNEKIEGEVELSHVLAASPGNVRVNGQSAAENCDADDLPVVRGPVTHDWNAVTRSHPMLGKTGVPVKVEQHEVVGEIERESKTPEVLVFRVIPPRWGTRFEFPGHARQGLEQVVADGLPGARLNTPLVAQQCKWVWALGAEPKRCTKLTAPKRAARGASGSEAERPELARPRRFPPSPSSITLTPPPGRTLPPEAWDQIVTAAAPAAARRC